MHDLTQVSAYYRDLPVLPEVARTLSGVEFYPNSERWAYRDSSATISLNFLLLANITKELKNSVKAVLIWYAENMSASHLKNMFAHLERYFRVVGAGRNERFLEINSHDLINYRATLSKRDSWYLGSLSGMLQKWYELGYPGVTGDAVALLKQLRIAGNQKGEAVLTMDPELGPFTDIEFQSIQAGLDRARSEGAITVERYLLVYLYMLLGQRSIQYAALKVCDIGMNCAQDGTPVYMLRIPRAKQPGQLSRTEFKERVLIPKIGRLLVEHANTIRSEYIDRLSDPAEAPLFPAVWTRTNQPKGFKFHRTASSLANTLGRAVNNLSVISERTGERLHITATRFRRTMGTRAAVEGHGELVIAELLDHSDTQNVGVYVEAVPNIVARIDRALAMQLAPLAQAFAGVLIGEESEASRAGDPNSRICDPRLDASMKPMGNCGKYGFCGSLAPIACYTCSNFQPWLDGPHEAFLAHLISERERLQSESDIRIASINDRTILAVAEVVRQCEEIRENSGEALHV